MTRRGSQPLRRARDCVTRSGEGVNGGSDCLQTWCDSPKMLRVPNEKQTCGREMAQDSADHFCFGILIEIDQYVSAEDEIEGAQDRIRIGVQIHAGESHDPVQLRTDLHYGFVVASAFQHVSAKMLGRDLLRFFNGVHCRARLFEDAGGDVGA